MVNKYKIQCKVCRQIILNEIECNSLLLSAHNEPLQNSSPEDYCESLLTLNSIYLNEEHLPAWLLSLIEHENWAKGKINCSSCKGRIGSFDFLSGLKCDCNKFVLPPVHLVKSKIDLIKLQI